MVGRLESKEKHDVFMNVDFQKGDIIKLKENSFKHISKDLFFPQNLFYIKEVNVDKNNVTLKETKGQFRIEDIQPVLINGKDDRDIYYDPIVAANVVMEGEEIPSFHRDPSTYYLNSLKKLYNEAKVSYYEMITSNKLRFVHEIQNLFPDLRQELKIHYHLKELINKSNILGSLGNLSFVLTKNSYDTISNESELKHLPTIYINRNIDEQNVIASFENEGKYDYIAICHDKSMEAYYRFYINSTIGKLFLLSDFKSNKLKGKTNISKIKKLPIYYQEEHIANCCFLQALIDFLFLYNKKTGKIGFNVLTTINRFLSSLRDSMVLEMILPKIFENSGVQILASWDEEVKKLEINYPKDTIKEEGSVLDMLTTLFNNLMASGNNLMENTNRLRLYMKDFMDFANRKMTENK